RARARRKGADALHPGHVLLAHRRRALSVADRPLVRDESRAGALRVVADGHLVRVDVPREPGRRPGGGAGRGDRARRGRAAVAPRRPGRLLHAVRRVVGCRRRADAAARSAHAAARGTTRMTLAELIRTRAADPADATRDYLRIEDRRWTFAETHREACRYANLFRSLLDP